MERPWPEEAVEFDAAVRGALARAGGVDLARWCEADAGLRETLVRPILAELGILDLDVWSGETEAAAAALGIAAAGAVVCPWPLVQTLAVPRESRGEVTGAYLIDRGARRLEHLDLFESAVSVDLITRETRIVRATGVREPMPLDPFGIRCELGDEISPANIGDAYVILASFWVAGALGSVRDLAAHHARERRQFGRRIADFGGIQWHLADIAVAHDGLWELASFTLARLIDDKLLRADTLALHYTLLEAARTVLDHAHQVLAAIGLCEEHDMTVLNRHLQAVLRRPCGSHRVLSLLADEVSRSGFEGLYPVSPAFTV